MCVCVCVRVCVCAQPHLSELALAEPLDEVKPLPGELDDGHLVGAQQVQVRGRVQRVVHSLQTTHAHSEPTVSFLTGTTRWRWRSHQNTKTVCAHVCVYVPFPLTCTLSMLSTSLVAYSGLCMLGAVAMTGRGGCGSVAVRPGADPGGSGGFGRGDVPYSPGWKLGSTGTWGGAFGITDA